MATRIEKEKFILKWALIGKGTLIGKRAVVERRAQNEIISLMTNKKLNITN